MARHAFDTLGYRRYEWKCNALNAPSRRAAVRLGFQFEGIFRQHMIVKGRSRDTAWFAMIDRDWPAIRAAYDAWLDPANFDADGRQLTPLLRMPSIAAPVVPRPSAVSVPAAARDRRRPASASASMRGPSPPSHVKRQVPPPHRPSAGRKHARQVPPAWRTLG